MTEAILALMLVAAGLFAASLYEHLRAHYSTRMSDFIYRRAAAVGLFIGGLLTLAVVAVVLIGYGLVVAL
jgi:uncharacterized membrane protein required for colicin V production